MVGGGPLTDGRGRAASSTVGGKSSAVSPSASQHRSRVVQGQISGVSPDQSTKASALSRSGAGSGGVASTAVSRARSSSSTAGGSASWAYRSQWPRSGSGNAPSGS